MNEDVLSYWYQALASPLGIQVVCSDPDKIRARLYTARKEAKDFDLAQIAVCSSPFDPTRLWLVKRSPDDAQT